MKAFAQNSVDDRVGKSRVEEHPRENRVEVTHSSKGQICPSACALLLASPVVAADHDLATTQRCAAQRGNHAIGIRLGQLDE